MRSIKFYIFFVIIFFLCSYAIQGKSANVQIVSDEAKAVLSVLEKLKTNQTVSESDWKKIFASEGYIRLKKRELSFKRSFEEEDFKKFVLSNELLNSFELLRATLNDWEKADINNSVNFAYNYLPKNAVIQAKIYPVIKPRDNSFVFEIKENPAIFLYLDPAVTKEQFENTLAHELHHIGFGTACPKTEANAEIEKLSDEKQKTLKWISAFGEGFAMLAAAGNAYTHPHKFSKAEERERWNRDMNNFNTDLKKVEAFFQDILAKRLDKDKIDEAGFAFFGEQGAWYTVGWKMSVVIEKTFGREKLIEVFCDQRKLLKTYNEAAKKYNAETKENLSLWSEGLANSF